ncbi:MAG: DUF59 domain-containing protein [Alphaproteobacteria bacterium]|nr:DUF59 domain-containing protein [Alphaproteobacteria bacterium]
MVKNSPSLADFMPNEINLGDQLVARAGSKLESGVDIASKETVITALRKVHDPEIPVNIYDLGLIYDLNLFSDGTIKIDMTLTAPTCPVAGEIPVWVAEALAEIEGIGEVEVNLVWEPRWSADRMTDEAKLTLNLF